MWKVKTFENLRRTELYVNRLIKKCSITGDIVYESICNGDSQRILINNVIIIEYGKQWVGNNELQYYLQCESEHFKRFREKLDEEEITLMFEAFDLLFEFHDKRKGLPRKTNTWFTIQALKEKIMSRLISKEKYKLKDNMSALIKGYPSDK